MPLCVSVYILQGICFIRITRPELKVIYDPDEKFEVGVAKVVRQSDSDKVTVIGAGVTLHEALTAADQLASEGKSAPLVAWHGITPPTVSLALTRTHLIFFTIWTFDSNWSS